MSAIKVKLAQVRTLVQATFPEYRGRKIVVKAASEVGLFGLNWCEGSRNQFRTCDLTGKALGSADKWNMTAPWANAAEGKHVPIPAGAVVVEHTIFQGRDCGLTLHVNPADMPLLLPAA